MTKFVSVVPPLNPELAFIGSNWALFQAGWAMDATGKVNDNYVGAMGRYKAAGGMVILDYIHPSSTGVGKTINLSQYFNFIENHRGYIDEFVIPDAFMDISTTLHNLFLMKTAPITRDAGLGRMFVPQGADFAEWLQCLSLARLNHNREFTTIGIPKWVSKFTSRRQVVDLIEDTAPGKQIHMLGVHDGASEMFGHERVRTWDTTLPAALAQKGVELGYADSMKMKYDYDIGVMMTSAQYELAYKNAYTVKGLLHVEEF